MIRYCANPTTVPITSDSNDVVSNRFFHTSRSDIASKLKKSADNRKIKIDILGITVNQVVTIVGTPSYTSGAQLWKGAAATLNKKPTPMISLPISNACALLSPVELALKDLNLVILSKLVNPV